MSLCGACVNKVCIFANVQYPTEFLLLSNFILRHNYYSSHKFNIMKKLFSSVQVLLLVSVVFVLSGCETHSPDRISGNDILKQFNEYLKTNAMEQAYVPIPVGTFEYNDDSHRYELRQLEAAGIITYDVERYAWWEKSRQSTRQSYRVEKYFWGYSYYDTEYRTVKRDKYDFMDHYIVNIALTPKGNKLVLSELPVATDMEDEDLKSPDIDTSKYAWNNADLTEYWEDIPNPFIEPEEPAVVETPEAVADTTVTEDVDHSDVVEEEVADDGIERIEASQYEKYRRLECDYESVYLKTYRLKGIKARNIHIVNVDGVAVARAEVVVATHDVSDVARVMYGTENDQRVLYNVELRYFYDKGWVIESVGETPMLIEEAEAVEEAY